jgi:hypothetical protein
MLEHITILMNFCEKRSDELAAWRFELTFVHGLQKGDGHVRPGEMVMEIAGQ